MAVTETALCNDADSNNEKKTTRRSGSIIKESPRGRAERMHSVLENLWRGNRTTTGVGFSPVSFLLPWALQRNRPHGFCAMSLKQSKCPPFFSKKYHLGRHLVIVALFCDGLLLFPFFLERKSRRREGAVAHLFALAAATQARTRTGKRIYPNKRKSISKKKENGRRSEKNRRWSKHGHVGGNAQGRQHRDRRQRDAVALVPARPSRVVGEIAGRRRHRCNDARAESRPRDAQVCAHGSAHEGDDGSARGGDAAGRLSKRAVGCMISGTARARREGPRDWSRCAGGRCQKCVTCCKASTCNVEGGRDPDHGRSLGISGTGRSGVI